MMSKKVVTIRKLRISDIYALNKMYDSLSEQSKQFFHPGFLGFESVNLGWLLAQFAMAASSLAMFKKLLARLYPLAAFLAIVSTDEYGKIVGFAFIKRKSRSLNKSSLGELGICVRDGYRGKRVGSDLMDYLLELAKKEPFQKICLTVLTANLTAVNIYEKCNFKKIRLIQKGDVWRGKRFDYFEMYLDLN
jgi:ribosomal protein S18 acetylase RimI-like enzyme